MSTIPATLHYCPQCWQELVSGVTKDGEPRICKLCILENVKVKAAFPFLHQSDEPEEQPEVITKPPRIPILGVLLFSGWCGGVGFVAGYIVGWMWPQ